MKFSIIMQRLVCSCVRLMCSILHLKLLILKQNGANDKIFLIRSVITRLSFVLSQPCPTCCFLQADMASDASGSDDETNTPKSRNRVKIEDDVYLECLYGQTFCPKDVHQLRSCTR